jgi:hypothetical protein
MTEILRSADDLKRVFGLADHSEFIDFTPFVKDIGFSVQRPYPRQFRYAPPVKKDGTPDTYALLAFRYEPERRSETTPHLVPFTAKISAFSRYVSHHWDYDFSDPECPTEASVIASKKTPRPVDLAAYDQYFYDHDKGCFIDASGKTLRGADILDGLYADHLATVEKFRGLVFRWKLSSRNKASLFCEMGRDFSKWLLRYVCGRTLEPDKMMRGIWDDYRPEDMKLLKTESIDVFGYKASKNVIVTFCTLLLLGYSIIHWASLSSTWLTGVANNSLLAFAFSILLISFLDHTLPTIFLWTINRLGRLRWFLLSKNVKFDSGRS